MIFPLLISRKWHSTQRYVNIRNHKHRRATAKPAACADSLSGPNVACDSGPVVYAYSLNFIWIGSCSYAIANMTARSDDKSKQITSSHNSSQDHVTLGWTWLNSTGILYSKITKKIGSFFTELFFKIKVSSLFTARCTIVQSAVLQSHVDCPSVCLSVRLWLGGSWPHRLKILEANCANN